jgi:hypothetical protein
MPSPGVAAVGARMTNPILPLAGDAGGYPWWLWAVAAAVVVLNIAAAVAALKGREHRSRAPATPPDQRRVRLATVLMWAGILAVAALIGLGIASAGHG